MYLFLTYSLKIKMFRISVGMYIHEIYLIFFYDIDPISFGYQAFTNIPKWVPFPPYLTMKKSVEEKLFVS